MTIKSNLSIHLANGQPLVQAKHTADREEGNARGWLDVSDALPSYAQPALLTIHFDDPQQVVAFAAALVEAVYPERKATAFEDELTDTGVEVGGFRLVTHPDVPRGHAYLLNLDNIHVEPFTLSDAGTDRLLADLRDGEPKPKVVDLMEALEQSVIAAKAARAQRDRLRDDRCLACGHEPPAHDDECPQLTPEIGGE